MDDLQKRKYEGQGNDCQYNQIIDPENQDALIIKEPYIASENLAEAVNDALYLRRPLLLEGEPGCGKTRLAYSVAYELGYPLKECYIRSTSRAQDLLYTYDAVRRLYDLQDNQRLPKGKYVNLGNLGEAIKLSQQNIPSVVLIDEIDKADIDFPNDLLLVLDKLKFEVDEVDEKEEKKEWKFDAMQNQTIEQRREFLPLIIVTSNRERELPKAFLRRCLFYHIEFPQESELKNIIKSHFQQDLTDLFEAALVKFLQLRDKTKFPWRKKPSTSEFINWLTLLERDEKLGIITEKKLEDLELNNLPYLDSLIKTQSDRQALEQVKLDE